MLFRTTASIGVPMSTYHCMIDLKPGARALAFAAACGEWMGYLKGAGSIRDWRLLRRQFGLASGAHSDFLLVVELDGIAQLDAAFRALRAQDDRAERLYDLMHQQIGQVQIGLYRPYPDPEYRERVSLV
jgi:hypothetical protein